MESQLRGGRPGWVLANSKRPLLIGALRALILALGALCQSRQVLQRITPHLTVSIAVGYAAPKPHSLQPVAQLLQQHFPSAVKATAGFAVQNLSVTRFHPNHSVEEFRAPGQEPPATERQDYCVF